MIQTVTLVTRDQQAFTVPRSAVMSSKLIVDMLCEDEEEMEETIPVPTVSGETLRVACEFMTHHATDPMPTLPMPTPDEVVDVAEIVPEWYAAYVKKFDGPGLLDMLNAANHLVVEPLLYLCACHASLLTKSADKFEAMFGEGVEMTAEEETRIFEENPWILEIHAPRSVA